MRIKIYNNFDSNLKKVWETLENSTECTPFQSYSWITHWQESVGKPLIHIDLHIVVIYEKEEVIAILPLGKRKLYGVKILEWLGGNITDYMCPLISKKNNSFINDFQYIWKKVKEDLQPIDLVFLTKQSNFHENNPFVTKLKNNFLMNSYQAILNENWETFSKENLSKKVLADSRRQRKRLSNLGEISFRIVSKEEDTKEITKIMIKQKSRRYVETGSWDMFSTKEYQDFYLNFQTGFNVPVDIHVSYLSLNNEIIATHWGLVSHDRFYYIMPTHEAGGWEKYSPGKLLLEYLIEWSIKSNLRIFDLTIGDEEYKKKWSNSVSPIYEHVSSVSFLGKIYLFTQMLKEYIKRIPFMGNIVKRIYNFFR